MRGLRWLLGSLLVLAVLFLLVDRVGAWAAGQVVADQVERELLATGVESAPPEVSMGGFPFLTQVAAGRYQEAELLLRDVRAGSVRFRTVDLTATGVTASATTLLERSGPIHADRVVGTGVVGYDWVAALAELDQLELLPAGDGSLRVKLPAEVLGARLVLVGAAELAATDQMFQVRATELTAEPPGELPPGGQRVVDQLRQAITVEVALPQLPYGLSVESVRAEPAGLAVTLSARDVPLVR